MNKNGILHQNQFNQFAVGDLGTRRTGQFKKLFRRTKFMNQVQLRNTPYFECFGGFRS